MMTLAVMSNPGNMSGGDMFLMFVIMCVLACFPVAMALFVLTTRLLCAGFKWVVVGVFAWLGWRLAGKVSELEPVQRFVNAFKEAYNKSKIN